MGKRIAKFLKGIDTIIFDMDGVITSEQNYWNAAALTVYEMLNSRCYYGNKDIDCDLSPQQIRGIRNTIFVNDKMISMLKDKGINTNWDLAYIVLCTAFIVKSDNFYEIYDYLLNRNEQIMELYSLIEYKLHEITGKEKEYYSRNGELWTKCRDVFQEWYLGDEVYRKAFGKEPVNAGKKGLMYLEQPIVPLSELKEILHTLYTSGIRLGIGTGRPLVEMEQPLMDWNVKKYFDEDSCISYTEVMNAEKELKRKGNDIKLVKPHPYVFLKAIYGKGYEDHMLLNKEYDPSKIEKTLIVGDAGSDIMAAQAINCKFAAVLTGISGQKAKDYFVEMKSDYILDSIRELVEIR